MTEKYLLYFAKWPSLAYTDVKLVIAFFASATQCFNTWIITIKAFQSVLNPCASHSLSPDGPFQGHRGGSAARNRPRRGSARAASLSGAPLSCTIEYFCRGRKFRRRISGFGRIGRFTVESGEPTCSDRWPGFESLSWPYLLSYFASYPFKVSALWSFIQMKP